VSAAAWPAADARPRILIADDNPANVDIFATRLAAHGLQTLIARDGEEALAVARRELPDLILLDIMMPKVDGIEVCRRLKADASLPFIPVILVTAKSDAKDVAAGLDAGAEEYLTKPVDQTALVARVRSMLRIKALHDSNRAQAEQLADWNRKLEQRVAEQLRELERLETLKRFFSPQVAEVLSSGKDDLLESHRRDITAVFCDLRGFTVLAEEAEPEDVMRVLAEYHQAVGPLIFEYEATLEHFAGDGLMAFFNDPFPCPDPARRAVRMACAIRREVGGLAARWRSRGHDLGIGIGIASGPATLGQIGFVGRFHYGAIGSVLNLASRLCDQAAGGQILITERIAVEAGASIEVEPIGALDLKGFARPVRVLNVVEIGPSGDASASS